MEKLIRTTRSQMSDADARQFDLAVAKWEAALQALDRRAQAGPDTLSDYAHFGKAMRVNRMFERYIAMFSRRMMKEEDERAFVVLRAENKKSGLSLTRLMSREKGGCRSISPHLTYLTRASCMLRRPNTRSDTMHFRNTYLLPTASVLALAFLLSNVVVDAQKKGSPFLAAEGEHFQESIGEVVAFDENTKESFPFSPVPAGKRLIIEHVSAFLQVSFGGSMDLSSFDLQDDMLTPIRVKEREIMTNLPTKIVVESGQSPTIRLGGLGLAGGPGTFISFRAFISGTLVPAP